MPITEVNQISTKTGDQGQSKNFVNETFGKDDLLFEVLGTMDELSSFIGLSYHYVKKEELLIIQRSIQEINTIVATNPNHILYKKIKKLTDEPIEQIESNMANLLNLCPLEPKFCLPGSDTSLGGAYIDVARSIARKAERTLVRFVKETQRTDLTTTMKYINRLSDYLFVLARYLNDNQK